MNALEYIRRLTSRMLEAAGAGEWNTLSALEGERRECLHHFFNRFFTPADAMLIAPVLEEILALDTQIIALSEQERAKAIAAMQEVKRARQAERAYGNSGTDI